MPTAQDVLDKKSSDVAIIVEEGTVMEAAKIMNERRIGSLVVAHGEKVVGIVSERDVLCRVVAENRDPMKTTIKDVMTSPVACCHPTTRLAECRDVMTKKRIRHLPVVDEGRLVGMISIGDIVAQEQREQQQTIEYLHEYLLGGTR